MISEVTCERCGRLAAEMSVEIFGEVVVPLLVCCGYSWRPALEVGGCWALLRQELRVCQEPREPGRGGDDERSA